MILEPSLNFSQKSVCNICMSYLKQIFLAPLIVMSVKSGREVQQDWTVLLTHVIFFSYDHRRDHCQSLFKEVKMLNLTRYNNKTIMISCSHTGIPSMKSSTLKGFPPLLFPPPPPLLKKTQNGVGDRTFFCGFGAA